MKINRLILKNFKQYREADISFPDGLTGFIGKNGAGKSTLFEAIAFAFFGKSDSPIKTMRNDKVGTNEPVIIELSFEDRGKEYRIIRKYKGKTLSGSAELYEEGKAQALSTSVNNVNKDLRRIIRIDYKNFCQSFFAHQKDVGALLNMNEKDRSASLRKMLGLDMLDKMEEKLKGKKNTFRNELEGMQLMMLTDEQESQLKHSLGLLQEARSSLLAEADKLNAEVADAEQLYKSADGVYKALAEKRDKHNSLEKNLALQNQAILHHQQQLFTLRQEIRSLEAAAVELERLKPVRTQYDDLQNKIDSLLEQKDKSTQLAGLQSSVNKVTEDIGHQLRNKTQVEDEIKGLNTVPEQKTSKNETLSSEMRHLESVQNQFNDLSVSKGEIQGKQTDTNERLKRISELGSESPCPECERPLGESYGELLSRYQNDLDSFAAQLSAVDNKIAENTAQQMEIQERMKNLRDELQKLDRQEAAFVERKNSLSAIESELIRLEKRKSDLLDEIIMLGDVSFDEQLLNQKQIQLKTLEPEYKKTYQLAGEVARLENVRADEKLTENKLNNATAERDEVQNSINDLGYLEDEYHAAVASREAAENKRTESKLFLKEKLGNIETKDAEIKAKEDNINQNEKLKGDMQKKTAEVNLYNSLETSVKLFKEKITSRELPYISAIASGYYSKITEGRFLKLWMTDTFELKVMRDGIETDVSTLSGGEKDLAALCLRIAISKRISSLAGRQNMGFLALDEVFGSQDRERRENLLLALTVISDEFKQIFVVSHNEDVQDQFPHRLTIMQKGGSSTAKLL